MGGKVLLLGDELNEQALTVALENAGHTVTDGGLYWDWNGVNPLAADFDVVLYVQANEFEFLLEGGANDALDAYVNAGGDLIRTEWSALQIAEGGQSGSLDAMMPVLMPDSNEYYENLEWDVVDAMHPIAQGVVTPFTAVDGGCSTVEAIQGATVVFESLSCGPMLTYEEYGAGKVLHLNDDFGSDAGGQPDADVLQVLVNSVGFMVAN